MARHEDARAHKLQHYPEQESRKQLLGPKRHSARRRDEVNLPITTKIEPTAREPLGAADHCGVADTVARRVNVLGRAVEAIDESQTCLPITLEHIDEEVREHHEDTRTAKQNV